MTGAPAGAADQVLMRLLVRVVRWTRDAGTRPAPLDPAHATRVAEIAATHRVLAALHPHAARLRQVLPEATLAAAARHYHFNAVQQMVMREQVGELLALLSAAGIAAAPIKGVVLADTVYRDGATRDTGDIDLLVDPPRFYAALRALLAAGYRDRQPTLRGSHLNRGFGIALYQPGAAPFDVDLHPVVTRGQRRLTEGMLRRAERSTFAGAPARLLTPEDTLIGLCMHLWNHTLSLLSLFVDVAEALDRFQARLDWDLLAHTAARAGIRSVVAVALLRTRDYLGAAPPAWAWRALGHPRPRTLLAYAAIRAYRPALRAVPRASYLHVGEFAVGSATAGDDDRARLRALAYAIWPSRETLAAMSALDPDRWPAGTRLGRITGRLARAVRPCGGGAGHARERGRRLRT